MDKNVSAARNTLFGFLGNSFSFKCKLSVSLQYHTWLVYIKPVLCSGLSALPVRPPIVSGAIRPFHHKVLRGILKLSPYSPVAPLYFLLGELPIEATLHLGVLALFWNIWANPKTKAFEVLQYLLKMYNSSSLTWSAHARLLFQQYNLPDPLSLLSTPAWPKQRWKDHTQAAVSSYHETICICCIVYVDSLFSKHSFNVFSVRASMSAQKTVYLSIQGALFPFMKVNKHFLSSDDLIFPSVPRIRWAAWSLLL